MPSVIQRDEFDGAHYSDSVWDTAVLDLVTSYAGSRDRGLGFPGPVVDVDLVDMDADQGCQPARPRGTHSLTSPSPPRAAPPLALGARLGGRLTAALRDRLTAALDPPAPSSSSIAHPEGRVERKGCPLPGPSRARLGRQVRGVCRWRCPTVLPQ
jgi:hypothetical protein